MMISYGSVRTSRHPNRNLLTGAAGLEAAGLRLSLDGVTADSALVFRAAGGESDLIAGDLAFDRRSAVAGLQGAGNHLVLLLEHQLSLRQLPCAVHFGGDD